MGTEFLRNVRKEFCEFGIIYLSELYACFVNFAVKFKVVY